VSRNLAPGFAQLQKAGRMILEPAFLQVGVGDTVKLDASSKGHNADGNDTMRAVLATHAVFDGTVDTLTGENAQKAKVGETGL